MKLWIWLCFVVCCNLRFPSKMENSQATTPVKRVGNVRSSGAPVRPWKWCMVCNTVLDKKANYKSFKPELKDAAELVRRLDQVLDVIITEVTPNSYNVCRSCLRQIKKVEDGLKTQAALKEDFKQTVSCNRLTSPTTTPNSSPANISLLAASTCRTKRMAKDQGTPPVSSTSIRERGPTGTGSRPRKRALTYHTNDVHEDQTMTPHVHDQDEQKMTPQDIVEVISNFECKAK